MANYIMIDGGTTNTRIALVVDYEVVEIVQLPIGAKNGIDDRRALRERIKSGITATLNKHKMTQVDIDRILASGMITSEFGLCELPHIAAPTGVAGLHAAMHEVVLEDISSVPFVFIRGVRWDGGSLEDTDMMRGEETELMGLLRGEGVYILPGSHSKVIEVDADGRIFRFKTMLTGEMFNALREHTILKDAVEPDGCSIDETHLLKGYEYARSHGINEALFKVRVLKNLFHSDANATYNFFLGVVLCDEVQYVLSTGAPRIVVSGQTQMKKALGALLRRLTTAEITVVDEEQTAISTYIGMTRVYEYPKIWER